MNEIFTSFREEFQNNLDMVREETDLQNHALTEIENALQHANPTDIDSLNRNIAQISTPLNDLKETVLDDPLKIERFEELKTRFYEFVTNKIFSLTENTVNHIDYQTLRNSIQPLSNIDSRFIDLLPLNIQISFNEVTEESELQSSLRELISNQEQSNINISNLILNIYRLRGDVNAEDLAEYETYFDLKLIEDQQFLEEWYQDPLAVVHEVIQDMGRYNHSSGFINILNQDDPSGECEARAQFAYARLSRIFGDQYPMHIERSSGHVRLLIEVDNTTYALEGNMPEVTDFSGTIHIDPELYFINQYLQNEQIGEYYPMQDTTNLSASNTATDADENPLGADRLPSNIQLIDLNPSAPENYVELTAPERQEYAPRNFNLNQLTTNYANNPEMLSQIHLLEGNPNDVTALNELAITLYDLGRYDEAETYLQRSLEIEPTNARALDFLEYNTTTQEREIDTYNNRGISNMLIFLEAHGRHNEKETYIRRYIEAEPNSLTNYVLLSELLYSQGEFTEAETAARTGLELMINPGESNLDLYHQHIQLLTVLENALSNQNKNSEQEIFLFRIIQAHPTNPSVIYSIQEYLTSQEKYAEAEFYIRRLREIEQRPFGIQYIFLLISNLEMQNKIEEAILEIENLLNYEWRYLTTIEENYYNQHLVELQNRLEE